MTAAQEATVDAATIEFYEGFSDPELRGKARRQRELADAFAAKGDDYRADECRRAAARYLAVLEQRVAAGRSWGPGIGPRPAAA